MWFEECCIGCKHCNECEVRKGGDIVVIMARVPTTRGCLPPVYNPMYRCKCPPFPVRNTAGCLTAVLNLSCVAIVLGHRPRSRAMLPLL